MSEVRKKGSMFVCSTGTMPECFERRLVGLTHRQWSKVAQVKKGDLVLLYNFDTKELIGPLTAASDPCLNIEPDAWGGRYPAQVRVEWDELHVINDAPRIFPWVAERTFELSEDLTQQAIAKLRGAPVFRYQLPVLGAPKISYRFHCVLATQEECLARKLFGEAFGNWSRVLEVKKGALVFLYNVDTKELIGPLTAASDSGLDIEHPAFDGRYPAQVRVEWDELHVINDAPRIFPWVDERIFKIPADLTQQVIAKLRDAPVFRYSAPLVPIDQQIQLIQGFGRFLDEHGVFSQVPTYSTKTLYREAKLPDFVLWKLGKTVFAEVKPTVSLGGRQELVVDVEDLERLQRLESCTGIKTLVAFPIDLDGGEWGAVGLPEISGGERRTMAEREYSALPVEAVKERGKSTIKELFVKMSTAENG